MCAPLTCRSVRVGVEVGEDVSRSRCDVFAVVSPVVSVLLGSSKPTLYRLSGPKIGSTEIIFISPGNRFYWMKTLNFIYKIIFFIVWEFLFSNRKSIWSLCAETCYFGHFFLGYRRAHFRFGVSNLCFV